MKTFRTRSDLQLYLEKLPESVTVGFVPTMGALHLGHKSLLSRALGENSICICSIFVNPKQFEREEDLKNYPRTLDADYEMLKNIGCHILFLPEYSEIYPKGLSLKNYDFGNLDKVMEGVSRPGHFDAVAKVVSIFFDIITPNKAYFGEKDAQQLSVIKLLKNLAYPELEIVSCPTLREPDGLAMSSRNKRLPGDERGAAARIYKRLKEVKKRANSSSIQMVKEWVKQEFSLDKTLQLDYFEICHPESLVSSKYWNEHPTHLACIAVYVKGVRLIDNVLIQVN